MQAEQQSVRRGSRPRGCARPPVRVAVTGSVRPADEDREAAQHGVRHDLAGGAGWCAGRWATSKRYVAGGPSASMTCGVRVAAGSATRTTSTRSGRRWPGPRMAATLVDLGNFTGTSRAVPRNTSTGAVAVRSRSASPASIQGCARVAGSFVVVRRTEVRAPSPRRPAAGRVRRRRRREEDASGAGGAQAVDESGSTSAPAEVISRSVPRPGPAAYSRTTAWPAASTMRSQTASASSKDICGAGESTSGRLSMMQASSAPWMGPSVRAADDAADGSPADEADASHGTRGVRGAVDGGGSVGGGGHADTSR